MSIRTLEGIRIHEGDDSTGACWYDSTSGWTVGPLFEDVQQADAFEVFIYDRTAQGPERVEPTSKLRRLWHEFLGKVQGGELDIEKEAERRDEVFGRTS